MEAEGKLLVSFLSFPWGSDRATGAHAPSTTIKQLLVCRFENLENEDNDHKLSRNPQQKKKILFLAPDFYQNSMPRGVSYLE